MFNNTLNKNLGPTRKFRPESYKANDQKAKDIIIPYLESNGHTIIDSKEDFGVDIKSEKGGNLYYTEVEMKNQWYAGSNFNNEANWNPQWTDLRIPYRKDKLLQVEREKNSFLNFYVFNREGTMAWRVKDSALKDADVKEANNKSRFSGIREGELFFHIPWQEAELVLFSKDI
jgi:hypothetical protein